MLSPFLAEGILRFWMPARIVAGVKGLPASNPFTSYSWLEQLKQSLLYVRLHDLSIFFLHTQLKSMLATIKWQVLENPNNF